MERATFRKLMQPCVVAFMFLTRIPMPSQAEAVYTEHTYSRSTIYYPFVGLIIGLFVTAFAWYTPMLLPANVSAALVLIVWTALTGALHLDGLMDTADGLLSHRSRERKLEIMKDSRVGAMGVIVCVCYLLLKFTLISSLVEGSKASLLMLLLIPIWSRYFLPAAIAWWPYARKDGGMGTLFSQVRSRHVWLAGFVALVSSFIGYGLFHTLLMLHGEASASLSEFGLFLLAAFLITTVCGSALAAAIARQLGGQTGDTYGAIVEILEVLLLIAAVLFAGTDLA